MLHTIAHHERYWKYPVRETHSIFKKVEIEMINPKTLQTNLIRKQMNEMEKEINRRAQNKNVKKVRITVE